MNTSIATLMAAIILALVVSSGCKSFDDSAGPALTGSIHGFVRLYDETGKLASNHGAVQVSLGVNGPSTVTDSTGKWSLEHLSTGIYEITYSKEGYATWKKINVQLVEGESYSDDTRKLYQLPSYTITSFAPETTTDALLRLSLKGTTSIADVELIVFIHTSSDVSSDPAHYTGAFGTTTYAASNVFNGGVSYYQLDRVGISSGTTIYLRAYPGNIAVNVGYTDPTTGRTVYPNAGSTGSNVATLVVP